MAGARALLGEMVGSYRIERVLGRGGMGEVYLAVHPGIGARVAIKVLAHGSEHADRFFDEARAVNLIRHPRIVAVHDFATLGDGRPYIVMELCEGASLAALLARGRLPIGTLVNVLCEVLEAAGAAHAKAIVHRDLKPENVFVLPDGHVKVLDFGIAKLTPEDGTPTRTSTGAIMGTPAYLSPEQVQSRPADARTDIYAVGVMAFEALTGQVPFRAPSMFELLKLHVEAPPPRLRDLRPDLPEALEEVVLRALAKQPDDRFASAAAMAEALQAAVRGLPPSAFTPLELPTEDTSPEPAQDPPVVRQGGFTGTAPLRAPGRSRPQPPTDPARPDPVPSAPAPAPVVSPTPSPISRRNLLVTGIAIGVLVLVVAVGQAIRTARRRQAAAPGSDAATVAALAAPDAAPASVDAAITATANAPDAGLTTLVSPPPIGPRPRPTPTSSATPTQPGPDAAVATASPAANPWLLRDPAPANPGHFDAIAYLPSARRLARRMADDAELIGLMATDVHPDGYSRLSNPMSNASYRFRSHKLPAGKCSVLVTVDKGGVAAWPEEDGCKAGTLPTPRCSIAEVWAVALAAGLTPQWSNLGYGPRSAKYLWELTGNQTGDSIRLECPDPAATPSPTPSPTP